MILFALSWSLGSRPLIQWLRGATGGMILRRFNLLYFSCWMLSCGLVPPAVGQNRQFLTRHCDERDTPPPPFEGGVGPGRFHFAYISDATVTLMSDGPVVCYERIVLNKHHRNQLWVHWKDQFGDVMNLLIGPGSYHSVYLRNVKGQPVPVSGQIDHGLWKGSTEGTLQTTTWRSAHEAQRAVTADSFPTIVNGFDIRPISDMEAKTAIPIKLELSSSFNVGERSLTYALRNLGSDPLELHFGQATAPKEDRPVVEWIITDGPDLRGGLRIPAVSGIGSRLEIASDQVFKVEISTGPVIVRLKDKIIFQGRATAYVPIE